MLEKLMEYDNIRDLINNELLDPVLAELSAKLYPYLVLFSAVIILIVILLIIILISIRK